ncbi:MAG: MBL fold metallo-hydrolase [Myxococcaceae bacterium]|nr:MBL fold metallo-hydrolase [Myxococcaceae bacterium]
MFLNVKRVELGDRLRVLLGGGGNSLVFVHGQDAFVTDVKMGDYALKLRREVEEELGRTVQRVMLTHAHFDHAGGLWAFPGVAVVLVHPTARARLEAKGVKARFVEVEREVELVLGGETVRVLNVGSGHTDGDLVAYFPGRKLLVAGDLFQGWHGPHVVDGDGGDIARLEETTRRLLELDVERIVPGHGELTDRAPLIRTAAYLTELRERVADAKGKGLSEDETAKGVQLEGYADLGDFFGLDSREKNVRRMYKALP